MYIKEKPEAIKLESPTKEKPEAIKRESSGEELPRKEMPNPALQPEKDLKK